VHRARSPAAIALFVSALTFRPQLVGVTPLMPTIHDSLEVGHAVTGLLVTIPVICMGVFAPLGQTLARRVPARAAIAGVMALVAATGLARAAVPGAVPLILLTVPIGIGIALSGVLLPIAAKERFSASPAFGVGVYVTGLTVGASLAALLAVPLASVLGWRGCLGALAVVGAMGVPVWLLLAGRSTHEIDVTRPPIGSLWRSSAMWALIAVFTLVALTFYGLTSWLADAYTEHGWSTQSAGALVSVFFVATIPGGVLATWLGDRLGSRRQHLVASTAIFAVSILGLILTPSLAWWWSVIGGVGEGAMFSLALTLPLDVADRPADVGRVSAAMLGVGYTLGGLAPVFLGALRDLSGSFGAGLWIVFALATANVLACASLSQARLRGGRALSLPAAPARPAGR
jgi:CP family cyanate transporter-like MFS transporter